MLTACLKPVTVHPMTTPPGLSLVLATVTRAHRDKGGAPLDDLIPLFASKADAIVGLSLAIRRGFARSMTQATRDDEKRSQTVFRVTEKGKKAVAGLVPRKGRKPGAVARQLNKKGRFALAAMAERAKTDPGFFEFVMVPRHHDPTFEDQALANLLKHDLLIIDPDAPPGSHRCRPTDFAMLVAPYCQDAPLPMAPGRPRLTPTEREQRRERHVKLMRRRRADAAHRRSKKIEEEVIPEIKPAVIRFGPTLVRAAVSILAKELAS